jgi:hypothetical protein
VYINGQKLTTSRFILHPRYGKGGVDLFGTEYPSDPFDVGLVVLPMPVGVPAIPIRGSRVAAKGESVRVFGYGNDESNSTLYEQGNFNNGPKQGEMTIMLEDRGLILAGAANKGACAGDSGGPLMAGSEALLVGVASEVFGRGEDASGNPICGSSMFSLKELEGLKGEPLSAEEIASFMRVSPDGGQHFALNIFVDVAANDIVDFILQHASDAVVE